jgi:hemolysin activation/secretion protein
MGKEDISVGLNPGPPHQRCARKGQYRAALVLTTTLLGLASLPACAQVTPTPSAAEAFLRQQERERVLREQQERIPDVRLPRTEIPQGLERLPSNEAHCVDIKSITLVGDSADRFQWAIEAANHISDRVEDKAMGRCLGSHSVNLVMRRIQNAIIARGYVAARVLAGPQTHLEEGTLELTLFPGRIRQIQFAPGTHGSATKWNAVPLKGGELLNLRDIEQALENFKRLPTAEADIQVVPAEGPDAKPGESDLVIQWNQAFPFRVSLSADDSGTRSTGKYQGSVTVSYDHWWTLNDLFYVSLSQDMGGGEPGARGTRGYTVHYSVPFGYWLLGFTASQNRFHQSVTGANQTYLYSGKSQTREIKLSRLIYRDAIRKTSVSLKGWTRASKNFIDDTEVEVQRRRMAGVDVGVAHRQFIGNATLDASLTSRQGTGARDSLPAPEEAFGEGTSRPRIITADAQLNAPFLLGEQRLRYAGSWRAQWNRTPLVPQDRFSIGNRYTVRGFDGQSQLLAERGWLVRNELGIALAQTGQEFYVGIDYGQVGGPSAEALIGKYLSGAVIGLRGALKGVSYDVFVGEPISKPSGFRTSGSVAGFNLNWSF